MYCSVHQQKSAEGACVHCGQLFCSDCLVRIDDKFYCKKHASELIREGFTSENNNRRQSSNESVNDAIYHKHTHVYDYPRKSRFLALVLCFFFGVAGFHRFYVGKTGTGLIYLCTGGFFVIGAFIDFVSILFGGFRDANGNFLE